MKTSKDHFECDSRSEICIRCIAIFDPRPQREDKYKILLSRQGHSKLLIQHETQSQTNVIDLEGGPQQQRYVASDFTNNKSPSADWSAVSSSVLAQKLKYRRKLQKFAAMAGLFVITAVLIVAIAWLMGWQFVIQLLIVAAVALFIAGGGFKWSYVALRTAPRDLTAAYRYVRLKIDVRTFTKRDSTIADIFHEHVEKHPDKVCFLFEDKEWTFKQVEEYSLQVTRVFRAQGYKHGDVVALLAGNRPEYVAIWLGLCRIGVITALINTNLRLRILLHSISISTCKGLIYASEFAEALKEIEDDLLKDITLFRLGPLMGPNLSEVSFDSMILETDSNYPFVPEEGAKKPGFQDHIMYIYTSGTTGMPKAAVISNSRFVFMAGGIKWMCGITPKDRLYVTLPLYHTAGGVTAVGQALLYGSSIVIRSKFSASAYFLDCARYKCTVGQYIGEMCRYLLAVKPGPQDKAHPVRLMYGNGLRPQIWLQFTERFGISRISEFYGATEGNANIVNIDNTVGTIGFVSRTLPSVYPISIIKVNPESGEVIRNSRGLCVPCEPGEPGVFIGKIIPNDPSRAFLGYVDKSASEKKIVRNIFKKGDSAFLSGDILEMDELGYLYFKDRTGDTFRWKGENVSTSEVEAVISNVINYRDAIVYGVEVPNTEGRAGMVAILQNKDFLLDLMHFANGVRQALPNYARPIFVRLLSELDLTGTFKLKKTDLQKEGFNPCIIKDPIYYLGNSGQYELVSEDIYHQILKGKIRL